MKSLRQYYRQLYLGKALLKKEKSNPIDIHFSDRVKSLMNGFTSESYVMYNLDQNDPSLYVTDYQQMKTGKINGDHAYVLNNKVVFEQINKDNIHIPQTIVVIVKGELMSNRHDITDVQQLIKYMKASGNDKVIMKPISDSRGTGIKKLELKENELYIDDSMVSVQDLGTFLSELDGYFISEYLKQSDFALSLYSETINSLRILTMIEPDTNEPFIARAVQRIGTKDSYPTDNFHRGGLSAEIDIETGVLGKAATIPKVGNLDWVSNHPDTQNRIEGATIPDWEEIKKGVLYLAKKNPSLKYVGWDIVLSDHGISILEGNSWADVNVFQIHRPMLTDERIAHFYKKHHII